MAFIPGVAHRMGDLGHLLFQSAVCWILLLFAPRFSGTIYWLLAAMLYALAQRDLFRQHGSEWAYSQALRRRGRLRRTTEIFSEAPADRGPECPFYYGRNKVLVRI
jgi:hypothetical protein